MLGQLCAKGKKPLPAPLFQATLYDVPQYITHGTVFLLSGRNYLSEQGRWNGLGVFLHVVHGWRVAVAAE